MKRKLLLSTVAILLVVSIAIVGCAQPAPAPAPAPPVKPIMLKIDAFWGPEYFTTVNMVLPTCKKIEEESAGRIGFEIYFAGALLPKREVPEALSKGVGDFGFHPFGYKAGVYPIEQIMDLPYAFPLDPTNTKADSRIMEAMHDKYFHKEIDPEIKLVTFDGLSGYRVMTVDKKVTSMEDIAGLKLRSGGGIQTDTMKALGITPVSMLPGDLPEALSRGILDGVYHTYAAQYGWGSYKYMNYSVDMAISTMSCSWMASQKMLDSLPPDLEEIVLNAFADAEGLVQKTYWDAEKDYFPGMGIEEIALSSAEKERWYAAVIPVWEIWMKDVEDRTDENPREIIKALASAWEAEGYTPPEAWAKLAK